MPAYYCDNCGDIFTSPTPLMIDEQFCPECMEEFHPDQRLEDGL